MNPESVIKEEKTINTSDPNIIAFPPGGYIYKKESLSEGIYFIQKGLIILHEETAGKHTLLYPGNIFGLYHPEMKNIRNHSAVCLTKTTLLYYSHPIFLALWEKTPAIIQNLLKHEIIQSESSELYFRDEVSIQVLYSILKMIYWWGKDSINQPLPVNQIKLELSSLKLEEGDQINDIIDIMHHFSIVTRISDKTILLKQPNVLQILIEFIQDLLLIKMNNPWEFMNYQDNLLILLSSFTPQNRKLLLKTEHFMNLAEKIFNFKQKIIYKILNLWKAKRLIELSDDEILINQVHKKLEGLNSILTDYSLNRNILFSLLSSHSPEYKFAQNH